MNNGNDIKHVLFDEKQQRMVTPDQVLQDLIEGNKRFYSNNRKQYPSLLAVSQRAATQGQFPKAVILACMDSRSIPEIVFDQSIADIFTLRVAGNITNKDILASLEYATKHAGSKLIVVMGHTHCGTIKAVCKGNLNGNLQSLANAIDPAVEAIKNQHPEKQLDCNDDNTIKDIAIQNVRNMLSHIIKGSDIIRTLLANGTIKIVGALHDLEKGVVTFNNQDC